MHLNFLHALSIMLENMIKIKIKFNNFNYVDFLTIFIDQYLYKDNYYYNFLYLYNDNACNYFFFILFHEIPIS